MSDREIINKIVECFDRPAFTTPFHREVNIPHFEKAITDTIEVLNTGVHRLRDGTLIRQIPSRHEVNSANTKSTLADIYKLVVKLRDTLVDLKRKQEVRNCDCGMPDCPTWLFSDYACDQMDSIRQQIFEKFRTMAPGFSLKFED